MRKIILPVLGILVIVSGIIIANSDQKQIPLTGTATISGIITDADFGNPADQVKIEISSSLGKLETITGTDGKYTFEKLEAGSYKIKCTAKGYEEKIENISLSEGEIKILDIQLSTSVITDSSQIQLSVDDVIEEEKSERKKVKADAAGTVNYAEYNSYQPLVSDYDGAYDPEYNTEEYDVINENKFKKVIGDPLSTFSIDVDNASYSNIRRFINYGQTPPKDAVRIEEMVNYFDYTYTQPKGNDPFSINYEMSECPWNSATRLIMIGLQGKDIDYSKAAPSNLVFLIDVSGSMQDVNKLPLVKKSLGTLVDNLNATDRVAIVVYAGAAGEVLASTSCSNKQAIKDALNRLEAGGSTAGGAGIVLAYDIAIKNLIEEGNNRVILCTDGDFNVGVSSNGEMTRLIEEKRKSGVFLTICGFGMGNYKDSKMETIADNGNGSYYYIDDDKEAKKVFTTDMRGTLFTIAKDVKIQIEFNPAMVEEYRLIGYENRILNKEDFDDDKKDAGELGAGHRVTALYEIKIRNGQYQPNGINKNKTEEQLKYQTTEIKNDAYNTDEIMTLKLRFKDPGSETSKLIEKSLSKNMVPIASTSDNFRFASAVAEFGMLLRESEFKGDATYEEVIKLANSARGADTYQYRDEFINLVKTFTGFAQQK
ncbi:MAG: von Willebrand factor type A domain-containing protein [Chitinophagales bacterium]